MAQELVRMSTKELDRVDVIRRVIERRLTQLKAAELMGLTARQVRRLCIAYQQAGPIGLASRRRGQPSNRRLPPQLQAEAVEIIRERYADFGPKLAQEKLLELHHIRVAKETLRKWMTLAGLWLPRDQRLRKAHQPRHRRECLGELVQIDGCEHAWFEERGPVCSLLVYVDDATGRLMELRFVEVESAFDYFASTSAYLQRHGKPTSTAFSASTTTAQPSGSMAPLTPRVADSSFRASLERARHRIMGEAVETLHGRSFRLSRAHRRRLPGRPFCSRRGRRDRVFRRRLPAGDDR